MATDDDATDDFLKSDTDQQVAPQKATKPPKAAKNSPPVKEEEEPPIQPPKPGYVNYKDRLREKKVFTRFGKLDPKELPVSLKMCPPVTRRQHAIYELLMTNRKNERGEKIKAIDHRVTEGPNEIEPQPYELAPSYTIYDRFDENIVGRNKVISFISGTESYIFDNPATGQKEPRTRPKIVSPFFMNGQKIVDIHANYLQYLWWELHPRNETNRYRDQTKKPIFRRVDLEHTNPNTELIKVQLRMDAHNFIERAEYQRLIGLCTAMNLPTSMPPLEMKLQLHRRADEKNGAEQILYTEPNNKATVKLSVIKAMDLGVLEYVADVQQFFIGTDATKPLWVVAAGKDPIDDLTAYFLTSGQQDYEEMMEQLTYWN